MSMQGNVFLCEVARPVLIFAQAAPGTNALPYVNLKNYERVTFICTHVNDGTGLTNAIGLTQATSSSGAGAKTLAFSQYYANTNAGGTNTDTLTLTTASGNTFNADATASQTGVYVLDVKAADLDVTNSFNYVTVSMPTANAHATLSVMAIARATKFGDQQVLSAK